MPGFNGVIFASKAWFILLWGLFLIALLAIWLSATPVILALLLSFGCFIYSLFLSYRYWSYRVSWLSWNSGDQLWQFREKKGMRGEGCLVLHATFISKLCLIIALRCPGRYRLYFIPVFYDAVPSTVYRRLKVLLRAYPHNEVESTPSP
ncbi:protein YgfX [Piscirickettsia litoralis]|uniref:protein YgfX n=1 Tax=Piscirickettsia litoralis TaxID=1891921 RepID=UPI0013017005|nr:protein YgfX [Piscirickettsia litoralis]